MGIREQALTSFDVNEHGIITSPGKFEAEMYYVPAFWEEALNGCGYDFWLNDVPVSVFLLTDEDKERYPELKGERVLALYSTSQGFVASFTWGDATEMCKREIAEAVGHIEWLEMKGD